MSPPWLLLHGFTLTGRSWNPVRGARDELPAAGFGELHTPDLRGHGDAAARRPITLEVVLDDLLAGPPQGSFALGGYSMGGRIALHLALAAPDRVERLLLIGASAGIADETERAERRTADDALAAGMERERIETVAERWASTPVLAGQSTEVRALADADRRRNTPEGLAAALRGLGSGVLPPVWDRLREIKVPVDIVVGAGDPRFRLLAGRMAGKLKRAKVHVVPAAGHAVHLERPDAVAAIMAAPPVR